MQRRGDAHHRDWNASESLPRRIYRAVATPPALGALIFVFVVLVAVVLAVVRSSPTFTLEDAHSPAHEQEEAAALLGEEVPLPTAAAGEAAPKGDPVFVHVLGEVQQPGVIELEEGDRVQQAIEAAGGVTDNASLNGVNLARTVIDGEQILVPAEGETLEVPGAASAHGPGLINLNHADASSLETLPRVGPALAARIIEWRETNGGFRGVDDLLNVSGIGPKVFAELQDLVTAP